MAANFITRPVQYTAKERPSIGDVTPGLSITYLPIYCKKCAKQYQQVEKIAKSFYLSKVAGRGRFFRRAVFVRWGSGYAGTMVIIPVYIAKRVPKSTKMPGKPH